MDQNTNAACCNKDRSVSDDITKILIFGVTGMIGRAVALSAVASPFMEVFGFTRQEDIDEGHSRAIVKGVEYMFGNMTDYDDVLEATKNMDVVFLNTFFWDSMSSKVEYVQGSHVVNAAVANGVKHLIYCSTDYNILSYHDDNSFFEAKAKLASYIVYTGIPYTLVRFSWFYENFLSVFRPHPTSRRHFAIALPMGGCGLNMGSLKDFAKCVTLIALRPAKTIQRTIVLSSTYLTVEEIAVIFNENFNNFHFYDPHISLQEYQNLDFLGAKELATMFRHYQRQIKWDTRSVADYGYNAISFEDWVFRSKHELQQILEEQIEENEDFLPRLVDRSARYRMFDTDVGSVYYIRRVLPRYATCMSDGGNLFLLSPPKVI